MRPYDLAPALQTGRRHPSNKYILYIILIGCEFGGIILIYLKSSEGWLKVPAIFFNLRYAVIYGAQFIIYPEM